MSLQLFIALLMTTVLAGYPIAHIAWHQPWRERLALSFGISLFVSSLLAVGIHLFGIGRPVLWMILAVWIAGGSLLARRRRPHPESRHFEAGDLALVGIALFVAVRTYLPHLGYPFPLHADELNIVWHGSTLARDESMLLSQVRWHHPIINSIWPGFDWNHAGINNLYGLLLRLIDGDPYRAIAPLAAWFAGLTSFTTGVLVTRVTKSLTFGAIAAGLWAFLRSDGFILGTELFVASSVALLLSFLLFLFLARARESRLVVATWLILAAVRFYLHPSTSLLIILLSYLVLVISLFKEPRVSNWTKWAVGLSPLPLVLIGLFMCKDALLAGNTEQVLSLLWFQLPVQTGVQVSYSWGQMIGRGPMILAFLGVVWCAWSRRLWACSLSFLAALILTQLAPLWDGTPTARYSRLFYETQALAVPLAAIGLYALQVPLARLAGRRRWAAVLVLTCLLTLVLVERTMTPDRSRYWQYMNEQTHRSLFWMDRNLSREHLIMALPSDALLLRALGFRTTEILPCSIDAPRWYEPILAFFRGESTRATAAYLQERQPSVVFSRTELPYAELERIALPDGHSLFHFVYRYSPARPDSLLPPPEMEPEHGEDP